MANTRDPFRIPFSKLTKMHLIGGGGYAKVYKVDYGGTTVAYKKLEIEIIKEPEMSLFFKESDIHEKLQHPNIVQLLGIVFEPLNYGLILEYMDHGDMSQYLYEKKPGYKEKLKLIHNVASGMDYLHSKDPPVIHGDLKIQNVLVSSSGMAKVSDFGFSDLKHFSKSRSANKVRLGTISHIPPENWKDPHLHKMEVFDVYGFGIFMFEVITEERPYQETKEELIRQWVINGDRPNMYRVPNYVSMTINQLLQSCWDQMKENRPSFKDIVGIISSELEKFSEKR